VGRTLEKERHDDSRFISRNKSEQLLILVLADRQTRQLISAMITFYVKSGFAQGACTYYCNCNCNCVCPAVNCVYVQILESINYIFQL